MPRRVSRKPSTVPSSAPTPNAQLADLRHPVLVAVGRPRLNCGWPPALINHCRSGPITSPGDDGRQVARVVHAEQAEQAEDAEAGRAEDDRRREVDLDAEEDRGGVARDRR